MGQDLKAENLTISIPNKGCDKNCPYCVSRMTGYFESSENDKYSYDIEKNIKKVKTVAIAAEVTSVLLTGKGEPMLAYDWVKKFLREFSDWPLELQTNGIFLSNNLEYVDDLSWYLNVLAVSVDSKGQFEKYLPLFNKCKNNGILTRITLNLTDLLKDLSFDFVLKYCIENKINQLTLRNIVCPENPKDEKTAQWIINNTKEKVYDKFLSDAILYSQEFGKKIRTLNHGVVITDIHGVAFSYSDYCIQERSNGNNIRSLIFQEDGHLYTSWNSRASILF